MTESRDNPDVIALPPLLFGGTLVAGLAYDFLVYRVRILPAGLGYGLGALLLMAAAALIAGAIGRFRSIGTNVDPREPTTAVITDGVYQFSRNPIYLAFSLAYLGIALAADSGVALILLAPLLVTVHYGVIRREERYLEAKFGDTYRRYRATVRRWI